MDEYLALNQKVEGSTPLRAHLIVVGYWLSVVGKIIKISFAFTDNWQLTTDNRKYGAVAQLGERLSCKQKDTGSNPVWSIIG